MSWLSERFNDPNITLQYCDSKLQAGDIFTKSFPDAKLSVWESNLLLIAVGDPSTFWLPRCDPSGGGADEPLAQSATELSAQKLSSMDR